jgi:hypothetical protein
MSFSIQELQQLKALLSTGISSLEAKSREQKRVIDELVETKQPFKQAGTKSVVDNINELVRYHYKNRDKVTAKLAKVRALQSAVKRELSNYEPTRRAFHLDFDDTTGIDNIDPVVSNAALTSAMDKFRSSGIPTTMYEPGTGWSDFKLEQPTFRTLELRPEDIQGHRGYVKFTPDDPDPSYMQEPERGTGLRQDGFKQVDKIVKDYIDGNKAKESNPKDMIGSNKLPLHLWPNTATAMGCLGFLNGMLKYGRSNFRIHGIRASIYYDAAKRHLDAWFEGEECDPDDGVPHLAAALACIAIIVDAQAAGKLNDDRAVEGGYRALVDRLTPHVPRLKALHADKNPYHYTIADTAGK